MFCPECGSPQQAAARYCSGCGARLPERGTDPAAGSAPRSPAAPAAAPESEPDPDPTAVKVLDAGDKLLLSGLRSADVEARLNAYLARGAKLVTSVCLVGNTWAAACTLPPSKQSLEDTSTLDLAELAARHAAGLDGPDDGCRVEEMGYTRIIYGPSEIAVHLRVKRMKASGAKLVQDVEEIDGEWVAVCDVGNAMNSGGAL